MVRFAKRIVLAFDADGAGKAAADRFYEWENRHNAQVFVAAMPEGQDPGQLAEDNPDALVEAITLAKPFLSYRLQRVIEAADLNSVEGRVRAAQSTAPIIAEHPNDVVRDQYIVETAERVRVEIPQLRQLLTQAALRPREDRNSTNADISLERP